MSGHRRGESEGTRFAGAPRRLAAGRHRLLGDRRGRILVAVLAVVTASVVVPVWGAASAAAAGTSLIVNSPALGGVDPNPGDGICETAAGNGICTLRAAIQESNALNRPAGAVSIKVDPSIAPNTKMTGTPNALENRMDTTVVTGQDAYGAAFAVTASVVIDLDHRLQVDGSANDNYEQAAFYLNAPDIQILNADQVMSSGSSFVVGPLANRVRIDGDTNGGFGKISTPNYNPERFVVFREGSSNVTVTDYQLTGYYDSASEGGLFVFENRSPYTSMSNIVVDRVQALYSSGSACDGSNGSGCRTRLLNFWRDGNYGYYGDQAVINGLTFRNMLVTNMTSQFGFQFGYLDNVNGTYSPTITDLVIEDNVFTNNGGYAAGQNYAFVTLPHNKHLKGANSISRNVFTRSSSGNNSVAIYYYGDDSISASGANPTFGSGLVIADNYFNNYTGLATIRTERSGLVTVRGNTFGKGTGSQSAPAVTEEYSDGGSVLYNTYHGSAYASNQGIRTWAPLKPAAVLTGLSSESAVVMPDPRKGASPTCTATVDVTRITATDNYTQAPGEPVTLQAYWTAGNDAELYLGQVTGVTGSSVSLAIPVPVGAMTLPDGTSATAVNATSGAASGYVRFQTHVEGLAQLESSQYSRLAELSGTCRPVLTIDQAAGMTDPTLGRDLHFTLVSSVPLDPKTVTADDISLTASAVAQTLDESRLNPRVVSVTEVSGSGGLQFDVVVRVDDSAKVKVAVAADQVATPTGLTNQGPATSTDNAITFLNPLQVDPAKFTLVTGEPNGKQFTLSLAAGAPLPGSDLTFTAVVSQPSGTPAINLSTAGPVLRAGQTSAAPVTVTAAEGTVTANTPTQITFTLASEDSNYDGLVVPSVSPYLFSTDPTIQITKTAYINVTDTTSAETIEQGELAPTGTRMLDGQTVCWVYTITNTSKDDWATALTDVVVTDSDTRLGKAGVIGTIPTLAIGSSAKLFACGSMIPVDTTTGRAASGSKTGSGK